MLQIPEQIPERFRAKWVPVRVKKTLQNKRLEPRSDSIRTEKVLIAGGRGDVREIRSSALTAARCFFHHELWLEK
jgi:hypothetical protein